MKVVKDLRLLLMKYLNKEFIKFVVTGLINTGTSYVIYLMLLNFYGYYVSFTVSYILGIILSYFLNTIIVFKEKVSIKKIVQFPLVYLVQYLISTLLLFYLVNFGINEKIVPIVITIITLPITFLLSKFIIKTKK